MLNKFFHNMVLARYIELAGMNRTSGRSLLGTSYRAACLSQSILAR